jgi:hypothetical protein
MTQWGDAASSGRPMTKLSTPGDNAIAIGKTLEEFPLEFDVGDSRGASVAGVIDHGLLFVCVLALFSAATALLFWQLLPHLTTSLIGPPEDNMQDFWNSWYAAAAHKGDFFYTNLIRFPQGTWLYYHSFAFTQIVPVVVLAKLFGASQASLILFQNITILATFPLAGTGTFYLVRHLTTSRIGAAVGAFVFAFNPSHVAHALHHAHVASIEFVPFFILAYLLALEKRSLAWLGASILFWALCALSSWYYLIYAGYFVIFHAIYLRVRDNKLPAGWMLFAPIASALGTLLVLSPLIVPMLMAGAGHQQIYAAGTNTFVADLLAFFAFPPTHLLGHWTQSLYARFTGNSWEATVYLGIANLIALGLLWWRTRGERDPVLTYALWGVVAFCVIACGECLHVGGVVLTSIHLPDLLLSKLPFVANARSPSRVIVLVYLFLSIGVGQAAAVAWRDRRKAIVQCVSLAIAGLMLLDVYPAHLELTPIVCPRGLDVIAHDRETGFGVLDLPSGYVEGNAAMLRQTCHGHPIAQGNVSRRLDATLADVLNVRDMAAQRAELVAAKIKYIVISPLHDGAFVWKVSDGDRALYAKTYRVVYDGPDMMVLRVP